MLPDPLDDSSLAFWNGVDLERRIHSAESTNLLKQLKTETKALIQRLDTN
jgi:hypothetical protein